MLIPRSEKVRTPLSCLASIKQGSNETLKVYVKRFNEELATIHNLQENGVLMAAILKVRPETPFWDKLQKDECKTLQEFYSLANKIMSLETAPEGVRAWRSTSVEASCEIAPAGKSTSTEKNRVNKKRRGRDRR